jgi:excisionase family DNA binding protein
MKERELLTVNEAANLLLVHTSTIHHMVREGRLKAYPIGKRLRFKREDINALAKK